MLPVKIILLLILLYLVAGLVFAIIFVIRGVDKIDHGAHGAGIGFRLIIIPGSIVFWPLLLQKWLQAQTKNHDATTS